MRLLICAAWIALAAAAPAPDPEQDGDCLASINEALPLADALPPSRGRDAVLRDIALAREARHENDERGCREQIAETLTLLHARRDASAGDDAAK